MKRLFFILYCLSLLSPTKFTNASHSTDIAIESLDGKISLTLEDTNSVSGASITLADLGHDGIPEIIVGNGMGLEPRVRVFRQDGSELGSFLAYAPTLGVGINVMTCDLTGDGYNEIIVAPQRGGGPHIRIFNRMGEAIDDGGFFSYDEALRTGVNLACGDLIEGDAEELVTLPAAGGGPHVRVWSWNGKEKLMENFFAFHMDDRSGLVGVVHDKTLTLAQQFTSTPTIKQLVIHTSPTTTSEEIIYIDGRGVESLAVVNTDIILSTSSSSTLYNLTTHSTQTISIEHSSLASFKNELIFTAGRFLFDDTSEKQRIEVDVSEQRLYAFEHGILQNSFLISSGLNNTTPIGTHSVLEKISLVHYAWNYGEGNPNNYDLGWIPYNILFYPHIYIHYAPWHNNFGHQMSHGCVNVNLTNIQWLYDWTIDDTPVEIKT